MTRDARRGVGRRRWANRLAIFNAALLGQLDRMVLMALLLAAPRSAFEPSGPRVSSGRASPVHCGHTPSERPSPLRRKLGATGAGGGGPVPALNWIDPESLLRQLLTRLPIARLGLRGIALLGSSEGLDQV